MDGIQFLVEVRSRFGPIPFILFTGRGREEVVIQAINSGADFYLQKGGEPKSQFAELSHKIMSAASRKRAEDALRESEEKYHNVIEDQTEFISRFLPDGMHIFVNDAYCRYFGVAREDILGHRFMPVLYEDDRQAVTAFFATLTFKNPVGTIDQRTIMPDGSTRWQRWSDRAIFDADGKLVEYQSVGRDITGQKEAEIAIKRSEAQLNAIIQSSPIPKFVIDKDHRVIHWNKALEAYSTEKGKG
jgi:PAS domain S-box-containing protein